jgi:hypothetical protein
MFFKLSAPHVFLPPCTSASFPTASVLNGVLSLPLSFDLFPSPILSLGKRPRLPLLISFSGGTGSGLETGSTVFRFSLFGGGGGGELARYEGRGEGEEARCKEANRD